MTQRDTPAVTPPSRTPLRLALWADAGLEAVLAVVLLAFSGTIADWYNIDRIAVIVAGALFVLAAIAIFSMSRTVPARRTIRGLAIGNIFGGIIAWAVILLAWDNIATEGRWVLGAAADSFALVGLLELLALHRHPHHD